MLITNNDVSDLHIFDLLYFYTIIFDSSLTIVYNFTKHIYV